MNAVDLGRSSSRARRRSRRCARPGAGAVPGSRPACRAGGSARRPAWSCRARDRRPSRPCRWRRAAGAAHRSAAAERVLHRHDRLDRVVVLAELGDEPVALVRACTRPAARGVISRALLGREHRVALGSTPRRRRRGSRPGSGSGVRPLMIDMCTHSSSATSKIISWWHARRVRLRHRSSEVARRLRGPRPDLRRVEQRALEQRRAHVLAAARRPRARSARRGCRSARGTSRPCSASACAGRSGRGASPAAPTAARCSPARARRSPGGRARRWPSGYAGHEQ